MADSTSDAKSAGWVPPVVGLLGDQAAPKPGTFGINPNIRSQIDLLRQNWGQSFGPSWYQNLGNNPMGRWMFSNTGTAPPGAWQGWGRWPGLSGAAPGTPGGSQIGAGTPGGGYGGLLQPSGGGGAPGGGSVPTGPGGGTSGGGGGTERIPGLKDTDPGNPFLQNLAAGLLNAVKPGPSGSSEGFGTTVPPQQQTTGGKPNWLSFTFAKPSTPDQENFNYLAKIDPSLAFSYAWQGGNTQLVNDLQSAMDPIYGKGMGALTGNLFTTGGAEPNSALINASGLGSNYSPSNYFAQNPMGAGGTFSYGGKSYTLPNYTGAVQSRVDPMAFLAANPYQNAPQPGSAEWYQALQQFMNRGG